MTADAGVGLVSLLAERAASNLLNVEISKAPDFTFGSTCWLLEILRDTLGFILSDTAGWASALQTNPSDISSHTAVPLSPSGSEATRSADICSRPRSDQGAFKLKSRIRPFQAVTPGTVVLNHLLDASLIAA
jgi:hypothetical protein